MSHTYAQNTVHVVFSTKKRRIPGFGIITCCFPKGSAT